MQGDKDNFTRGEIKTMPGDIEPVFECLVQSHLMYVQSNPMSCQRDILYCFILIDLIVLFRQSVNVDA